MKMSQSCIDRENIFISVIQEQKCKYDFIDHVDKLYIIMNYDLHNLGSFVSM